MESQNEAGTDRVKGYGGRQLAQKVLWDQAEAFERKAKALRMLGNMFADLPREKDSEDPIEPLLWELVVHQRWR